MQSEELIDTALLRSQAGEFDVSRVVRHSEYLTLSGVGILQSDSTFHEISYQLIASGSGRFEELHLTSCNSTYPERAFRYVDGGISVSHKHTAFRTSVKIAMCSSIPSHLFILSNLLRKTGAPTLELTILDVCPVSGSISERGLRISKKPSTNDYLVEFDGLPAVVFTTEPFILVTKTSTGWYDAAPFDPEVSAVLSGKLRT